MGPDGSDHVWNMLMARSAQGLLKFNFESAPPAKTDLEAIELTETGRSRTANSSQSPCMNRGTLG